MMCLQPQPWNKRKCDLPIDHDGNHETWLTLGRTRNYWPGSKGPVKYRVANSEDRRVKVKPKEM